MQEVTSSYNANEVEERVQKFWREQEIYPKVRVLRSGGRPFFFVDGPPYTTGYIHLGTAWNKILKDSILRFYRMHNCDLIERAGYDMHGLPIEVKVEHSLGFTSKKDIEEYGIGKFIEQCRQFALTNKDVMSRQFQRLGVWLDFENPYQTVSEDYIEAAWWTLQKAHEHRMLEQGHRVVNWCPRCETAIADSEVDYWDETDPSIYVRFPLTGKDREFLVIWTTTPWTLPANVAVAVHPEVLYAKVAAEKGDRKERLWIAKDLVEGVLRKGRYTDFVIEEKAYGRDLVGWEYGSPLARQVPFQAETRHRVVSAEFVALENTGLVHIAPGHGWDDYLLGMQENLPVFCPVDQCGRFTAEGGIFESQAVREANERVLDEIQEYLVAREEVSHRYGHCWRCKTPIIFRATQQWFLKASEIRDRMLEEAGKVAWYPEWAGSARFYDWVKEARDWCISRQRYWGIPIPIWQCARCRRYEVIGTIAELEQRSGSKVLDPHRPYVDTITMPCTCGGVMHRVEDIFDVWFDSAVASWATLGFPRMTEAFGKHWPADFITEGQDQTRGWFYSQLGASTIAFGRSPYRSVLMHGFALDAEGRKMSKSLGNVVRPEEVISQFGADVLRLYILSANAPWDDLRFNWEGVRTVNRAVNIFWNVYRFPLPYMTLDTYAPPERDGTWDPGAILHLLDAMPAEDRWILSRMNSLSAEIGTAMETYQLHRATRALQSFILDDLSRWYIQLVRSRMWREGEDAEKQSAYDTTYHVLRRLIQLLAPFAPHITEQVYQNLRLPNDPESLHMEDWPAPVPQLSDPVLEKWMAIARSFDEATGAARHAGKRKLRWPVRECVVVTSSEEVAEAMDRLGAICRARANTRALTVVRGTWERIGLRAEPFMKAIGRPFGKDAPRVKKLIERADGTALKKAFEQDGSATLEDGGAAFTIHPDQVRFHEQLPENVVSAPMKDAMVYVDLATNEGLEAEGYTREVIRRLQEMRRQQDLRVEDNIRAEVWIGDLRIAGLVSGAVGLIQQETRARELSVTTKEGGTTGSPWDLETPWDVEGVPMVTRISRLTLQ